MGKATFRAIDVGIGDCIFLTLEDNEKTFTLMVDCGKVNENVRQFIDNDLHRNIDLLIVTHIDNDHIDGIKSILSEFDDLTIGHIIYNCAQRSRLAPTKVLPEALSNNLETLRTPTLQIVDKGEVAAHKALTIAEKLISKDNWRTAWEKQDGYVTTETEDLQLPDNFGKLIFLSPEPSAIERLDAEFRKAFNGKLYDKYNGPYDNEATIYEILMSHRHESEESIKLSVANEIVSTKLIEDLAQTTPLHIITSTNIASLAFIWEHNDKRILFCGDADPEAIVYNYLRRYSPFDGTAKFTAIKVPHHGSEHNSGSKFWETFDSDHIFFTGADSKGKRPSKVCIAKVIVRESGNKRHLHFTTPNLNVLWIDKSSQQVKDTLGFNITTDCVYEFEY